MANANASHSLDGTTVTITLSAEHAQLAAAGVNSMIYDELEDRPRPWV